MSNKTDEIGTNSNNNENNNNNDNNNNNNKTNISLIELLYNSELSLKLKKRVHNSLPEEIFETKDKLEQQIKQILNSNEIKQLVWNEIFHARSRLNSKNSHEGELDYIIDARKRWENQIVKSINTMCTELGVNLATPRNDSDIAAFKRKWKSPGGEFTENTNYKPIYSKRDFFNILCKIRNPNYKEYVTGYETRATLGLIKLPLDTLDITQMQTKFADLALEKQHLGVELRDDANASLIEEKLRHMSFRAEKCNLIPVARKSCRFGIPQYRRCLIWSLSLDINLENNINVKKQFSQLEENLFANNFLVDQILINDVKGNASNDDRYFVFEDQILRVLLCFPHDTTFLERDNNSTDIFGMPLRCVNKLKNGEQIETIYPPCGIIPIYGISYLISPLCYILNSDCNIYAMFKALYRQYFHNLYTISSHTDGILSLCKHFEMLLLQKQPELFLHLLSIGYQPLKIASKWLLSAFSDVLDCEQVLLIWDRIIGFDTLLILPITAAGIFEFRKSNLMLAQKCDDVDIILSHLDYINIIPIIQQFLYLDDSLIF